MADWTTKVISENVEIDLHPDLDSFPAQIRTRQPYGDQLQGIVLSDNECFKLMLVLMAHFNVPYNE